MPNCGGTNQPPCKPVPTTAAPNYTPKEMDKAIDEAYQKGIKDQRDLGHVTDYQKSNGL